MEQYISKSALVAEIEKRINDWTIRGKNSLIGQGKDTCESRVTELNDLLSFLNTIEVKETPDSDNLEEEIENELERTWYGEYLDTDKFRESAKHFFELGLKAQKGE